MILHERTTGIVDRNTFIQMAYSYWLQNYSGMFRWSMQTAAAVTRDHQTADVYNRMDTPNHSHMYICYNVSFCIQSRKEALKKKLPAVADTKEVLKSTTGWR